MSYRQSFETVFDVSENDPVLANAQPVAPLPFAMHRFNVYRPRFAEVGDALENADRPGPIDRPQLRPRLRRKGKARGLFLAEDHFGHLIVILANNRLSGVCLRNPSSNGLAENRANGVLREELQKALGCRHLGTGRRSIK